MPKLLCVYCSSSDLIDAKYHAAADELGREIAARGWGLVYGGGRVGLMGVLARAVKAGGGYVVGVIPEFMIARELAYAGADELVTVATMRERKKIMEERASAFVALPGGIGTLEEFSEIVTLRYLNRINLPTVLFNQDGFYGDLLKFFARLQAEGFFAPTVHNIFTVAENVSEVWQQLEHPQPFRPETLWRDLRGEHDQTPNAER